MDDTEPFAILVFKRLSFALSLYLLLKPRFDRAWNMTLEEEAREQEEKEKKEAEELVAKLQIV